MKNKFIYEILLTTQYATEEAWLNLILEIGKLNGFLKKTSICSLPETHFKFKGTHRLNTKRWKKMFHVNGSQKT